MSPPNKKNSGKFDFFSTLNDEIQKFREKGTVLVQGDLNARTGIETDFVESDKYDDCLGICNFCDHGSRNSEDKTVNKRGRDLLDLCKVNDLLITNGRSVGDLFGKCTSHQWSGSALNDYLLTPFHFIHRITNFSVGDYIPWLSDHCPIYNTISLKRDLTSLPPNRLNEIAPSLIFDSKAKRSFQDELNSQNTKLLFSQLIEQNDITAAEIGVAVKDLLNNVAKKCDIKTNKRAKKNKTSPDWFDRECVKLKNEIGRLGNSLKKDPGNSEIRSLLFSHKKAFKKVVENKKRNYKQNIMDKLSSSQNNQKYFWKLLDKLSEKKEDISSFVSHDSLRKHFQSILNSNDKINIPPESYENGVLDHTISLRELEDGALCLKPGKSVGVDNLSNEMISCLVKTNPEVLVKLFNLVLTNNTILPDWRVSYIVPIHKEGDKSDPANYRGISLLSSLSKLFLSILNNRLLEFVTKNNILSDNQLGFRKGNRTSDAHIILQNLIDKYCHKKNKRIFSCFIDFSKAFDSVPRGILLERLFKIGIKGKVFNIIRNIYSNDQACIKINKRCTDCFTTTKGVRQGCILSPLLFNIFLSQLARELNDLGDNNLSVGDIGLNSIFWADDIILLAESEKNLEELINITASFSNQNKLSINIKKTKCLIFNKSGRFMRNCFFINGVKLENVREYKYLGFKFTPSGEISTGLNDLRERALKAFYSIKNKLGHCFRKYIFSSLSLFDSLVSPILLYASDFWGARKQPSNNPLEKVQMRFFKEILGVGKKTANIGVLLELGRHPLLINAIKLSIKNWERIRKGDANSLLLASYSDSMNMNLPWTEGIKKQLEGNGQLIHFLNTYPTKPYFIFKTLYTSLIDQFHQGAFSSIKEPGSKLRTYALIKNEIGFERYLKETKKIDERIALTKFRLSNHSLMIEKGRYIGLKPEERLCSFCHEYIEDEIHFLVYCPIYKAYKQGFDWEQATLNLFLNVFTNEEKFLYLFNNIPTNVLANFIHKSFKLREFLILNPKRLV